MWLQVNAHALCDQGRAFAYKNFRNGGDIITLHAPYI